MKPKKEESRKNKLYQIEISVAVLLALVIIFSFFKPTITGYAPVNLYTQDLNLNINRSTSFLIASQQPLEITSFKINGEVEGGLARIYLDNMEGQKLLVYENLEVESRPSLITGMASSVSADERGEKKKVLELTELNDFVEFLEPVIKTDKKIKEGPFEYACGETCAIKMNVSPKKNYKLVILLEEGAVLKIKDLILTVSEE